MTTAANPAEQTPAAQQEAPIAPDVQQADQEQPQEKQTAASEAEQPTAQKKGHRLDLGCLGGLLYAVNRPWLLVTIPLMLLGIWTVNNTWIITDNINKPYALLAGPVLVASLLSGWLIFKFFRTIEAWCKMAWRAFFRAQKEDSSAQFFWMVIIVFMIVSVFASGSFFTNLEHDVIPGLGYVTALFIDLVAVQSMRARLNAVRLRDKRGEWLYLFGVFVCSGASAFANVYTSLADFNQHVTGVLPPWMLSIAPWFGLVFPALILLLSITADYTLDQTSTKLDPENYKAQEEKRMRLLEIQRDMLQRRVQVEQEIDRLSQQLRSGKQERTFFLVSWFFPKQPANVQQIAAQVTTQMQGELNRQLQSLYTHLVGQIGQAHSVNLSQIQAIQGGLQQMEFEFNLLLQERQKTANFVAQPTQIVAKKGEHLGPNTEFNTHEIQGQIQTNIVRQNGQKVAQKSLSFTPNTFHKKALEFIQNHPEWKAKFEEVLRSNPRTGFEDIAAFIRRQPGMNFTMITGQFVAEVLSLLQVTEETSGQSEQAAKGAQTGKMRVSKETGREPVNVVKAPVEKRETGEQEVNIQNGGETGEHLQAGQAQQYNNETERLQQAGSQGDEGQANSQQSTTLAPDPVTPLPEISEEFAQIQPDIPEPNTEGIPAVKGAKITRDLTPNTALNTHEIQSEINSESVAHFGPNHEQIEMAISSNLGEITAMPAGYIALNLEAAALATQGELGTNFEGAEDEIEGNLAKGNRGPYHMTVREIADQYQCSLEQVHAAVEQNMIRVSGRTNQKADPLPEWKILISSLEGFVPPQLPKKRGRKPARVLETANS
jgi:hypothetical protein